MKLQSALGDVLKNAVVAGEIAGAGLLVLKDGQEVLYTQCGYSDREGEKPFARDTLCRAFSMSKPVTAAAAMLLMERGQLDLGQSVGDILPAFQSMQVWEKGKMVPARRNILVRDLLSMTSGLSYPGIDASGSEVAEVFSRLDTRLYSDHPMSTMELMQELGKCALAFHPGDQWMYGTSADVLGGVIEKISGVSFGEFLRREFFEPLGMKDTGFWVPPEKQHRLARVYEQTPEGVREYVTNNLGICYSQHRAPAFESGGAGLVTTIDDYAAFARMLIKGGMGPDRRLLSEQTVGYMTSARLLPWQQESLWRIWDSMAGYGYGSLMRILEQPGMAVLNGWQGEYGWDGWLGTYFCNSPQNGITFLLFTQRRDAGTMPLTRKLRNVLAAYMEGECIC